ncbi:unnamed protein product, partial [Mesorhabditis spiculigera]
MIALGQLPSVLVFRVVDQLSILEHLLLQRVTKGLRSIVNSRCLLPRTMRYIQLDAVINEEEDVVQRKETEREAVSVIRCQQCQKRYGTETPWSCLTCEELWDGWYSHRWQFGRPPPQFIICLQHLSHRALAQHADSVYKERIENLHGGKLRFLSVFEPDTKIMEEKLRLEEENWAPEDLPYFRISAFGKDFLAALVSNIHGGANLYLVDC